MEFKSQRVFLDHLLLPIHLACYHNRKRKTLIAQDEFGNIKSIERTELCSVKV